jgi:ABC-type dipeptide/oligopeptide/nickel transport system permease component/ABC-type transport system substrate-binding protein
MRWVPLKAIFGAASAFTGLAALFLLCGWLVRPDLAAPVPQRTPEEIAEITVRRDVGLQKDQLPSLVQEVDYRAAATASWRPRGEAPLLAELVREGKLEPVAQRVGPEPVVLRGAEGAGNYGGDWYRLANSIEDLRTIYWRLSYPNLVRWSPQGRPLVPHIAKAWESSADAREWTFTLREGMRWSDGAPFTANDLVFWYEHEVKYFKAAPRVLRASGGMGRVEKVDRLRVKFVFDQPNPLFAERVASVSGDPQLYADYCTPAHYLRRFHPEIGDKAAIAEAMRSLGLSSPLAVYRRLKHHLNPAHPRLWPWVYRTYSPNAPHVFVRNPYYFAVDAEGRQLPYLDRLVLDIRPSNLIGLAAATGQPNMQERHIRYEDHVLLMSEAARNGYSVYHWQPATRSTFTIFPNLNRRIDPAQPDTQRKHELLNDDRFRHALSLAIDRRAIIDAEFNGQTEPAQLDPGPDSSFHNERLMHAFVEHDPARANALLDAIGLTRRDAEGYRTFADGSRMTWFMHLTDMTANGPAQFIVDDWGRVGVRCIARIKARKLFESEMNAYEHDFTVYTGESEFYPLIEPRNFLPTYRWSSFAPGYGIWFQNGGLYGNPAAKRGNSIEPPKGHPLRRSMELYDEILRTTNEGDRLSLFKQITDIGAAHLWHISLSTPPPQLVVVSDGLRNVPHKALVGANLQSPGNTGMELYFWEKPTTAPEVAAHLRHAMTHVDPMPGAPLEEDTPTATPRSTGVLLRALVWGALALVLVAIAVRHPFIARRMLLMIPTLGVVSVLVFIIVQLPPGDFVETKIMELELAGGGASEQQIADLRRDFRLDQPLPLRYLQWVGLKWFVTFNPADTGLLQGDLGLSMEHNKPVNEVVGDRIVLTVVVSLATIVFTWLVALPVGIYSAVRQYSAGDYALTLLGFLGMSVPPFLLAVVLMWVANRWFGLSVSGLFSPEFATMPGWTWPKVVDLFKHLWIPVLVLGVGGTASMIRVMRANLLDELRKPYVTTARAKGVRPMKLLLKYPVRLALNPFVSGLGSLFPHLVSGGAIVALVLSLPMVGPVMLDAVLVEDVYLAGSMLMVLSLLGVCGTLVSDLLLLWLDPRIRMEGSGA